MHQPWIRPAWATLYGVTNESQNPSAVPLTSEPSGANGLSIGKNPGFEMFSAILRRNIKATLSLSGIQGL